MIYSIKQAFKQFFRNGAMSTASVLSITAILLILGLFFLLIVNVSNIAARVENDFDSIQVYLLDEADEAAADYIMGAIKAMPEVQEVEFLPREQAMEDLKAKFGDKAYLLELRQDNPLPNSIMIRVGLIEDADKVVEYVRAFEGIEGINYYKETVERLIKLNRFIQYAGLMVIFTLVIISVIVVSNTIKLMVLAREREIGIMKYVGATNWFIRGPFLVEGILIGLISAGVSVGIVAFIYYKIEEVLGTDLLVMLSSGLVSHRFMIENLAAIFAALGVSIGACGSIISMRRFLDT
ncbi:MAG: permease-like cell division protein FtsX [Clostridiales Family XIII bacterium]|jgi:cell division transport system permease protein|nr:permease-like cell division protein FtsX [Clostridiales Family XIII bacterium]